MRWLEPDWRAEVDAWIEDAVGGPPAGAVEQPHVVPWSTVLRVPADDGVLWFKATAPVHRFEAALTLELARAMPDRTPEVVAADPERGWLLLRDAGARLREAVPGRAQLEHWERLLPRYAELQLALARRAEKLLELGVPDARLDGLAARLEQVLDGRPEGLSDEELARLYAAVPEVASLSRELADYGVAETLQHDDFHDGQVFVADGAYRFLDWGDSCLSHPFHTLVVTLRFAAYKHGLEPGGPEVGRMRDAYLEPFGSGLVPAVDVAYRTGTVARSLAWARYVAAAEDPVDPDDASSVAYGLRLFLRGGPIGTWDAD